MSELLRADLMDLAARLLKGKPVDTGDSVICMAAADRLAAAERVVEAARRVLYEDDSGSHEDCSPEDCAIVVLHNAAKAYSAKQEGE